MVGAGWLESGEETGFVFSPILAARGSGWGDEGSTDSFARDGAVGGGACPKSGEEDDFTSAWVETGVVTNFLADWLACEVGRGVLFLGWLSFVEVFFGEVDASFWFVSSSKLSKDASTVPNAAVL